MKHNSLDSLSRRLYRLADEAKEGMERKVETAVRTTTAEAILRTPVDTGEARSSWEVGVGYRPDGRRRPFAPYRMLHNKQDTFDDGRYYERANAEGALTAMERALAFYRIGQTVHVVNAVRGGDGRHYLRRLERERGYSLQGTRLSPLFWTEIALSMGRRAAARVKIFGQPRRSAAYA